MDNSHGSNWLMFDKVTRSVYGKGIELFVVANSTEIEIHIYKIDSEWIHVINKEQSS